ncbi:cupredoxin domain-containing protein [Psychromonas sp.]|uniref:cupredoxin domain-containing protein n=1 Tax=Psychromonas sp. TaxID=1884585 RepID=UPI00356798B9
MLFINLAGLFLIALIIWWFWLYSPKQQQSLAADKDKTVFNILVGDGVYQPATILISPHKKTVLNFIRKDATPCAEMVIFPELNISEALPLNKEFAINLPGLEKGKYQFHCQMQMYKGVVIVK